MKLQLGVIDIPYAGNPRDKREHPSTGTETTGDVADWLEKRYGLMDCFVDLHEKEIVEALETSVATAIENLMRGAPPSIDPFGEAIFKIETLFKFQYIDGGEPERAGVPGVPTKAAQMGVNYSLKSGKGNPRVSFVNTGLYRDSFKAWIE